MQHTSCREARRDHGGNDSALGALGGLTTQSLGVTVTLSDVSIGSLRLLARRQPGLHVDFDGGSRGNPGVGGTGSRLVLVRDSVCTVLATRAAFLQERRTTNNVAEFSGLIGGLDLARDFLAQSADLASGLLVTVRGDSRLVIDLVQDRAEGRDPRAAGPGRPGERAG